MSKSIISQQPLNIVKEMAEQSSSIEDFAKKIGYSSTAGTVRKTIQKFCEENNIDIQHFSLEKNSIKRTEENIFIENSSASQTTLRKWYKKGNYTEYKCAICGLEPIWNGQEITLTLDHINGNNTDDRLENLRWVCPNCDRQLSTFAGRNIKKFKTIKQNCYCENCGKTISSGSKLCLSCYGKTLWKVEHPSKKDLENILKENNGNFAEVGRIFGVNDNTIRKWCKKYDLPYHSSDYKAEANKQLPRQRKNINYLEVIETYKQLQNIQKTSDLLNIHPDTIHDILTQCNIPIKTSKEISKEENSKPIIMMDKFKKEIKTFISITEAANYISEQGYSKSSDIKGIGSHISQVCSGQRKTAYSFIWKYDK